MREIDNQKRRLAAEQARLDRLTSAYEKLLHERSGTPAGDPLVPQPR
jgi:hypothetical protein